MSDCYHAVEFFAGTAIPQSYLTFLRDRNALPELSVIAVFIQIIQNLRKQLFTMLLFEFIPFQVYIIVCQFQGILNIFFVCAVEDRGCYVKAEGFCSQREVNLKDLTDIHTGRYAQRIQYDVQRTTVGQVRHIFYRQYTGNDTFITMTACHLIADRDLSLLCDIDAYYLIYTWSQLITILTVKYLCINNNTICTVWKLQ